MPKIYTKKPSWGIKFHDTTKTILLLMEIHSVECGFIFQMHFLNIQIGGNYVQ